MLGIPKPKESTAGLLKARSVLQHDHGRLHVKVGDPIFIHEFNAGRVNRNERFVPGYASIECFNTFHVI